MHMARCSASGFLMPASPGTTYKVVAEGSKAADVEKFSVPSSTRASDALHKAVSLASQKLSIVSCLYAIMWTICRAMTCSPGHHWAKGRRSRSAATCPVMLQPVLGIDASHSRLLPAPSGTDNLSTIRGEVEGYADSTLAYLEQAQCVFFL